MAKIGKIVKVFFRGIDISDCILSVDIPTEDILPVSYLYKEDKEDQHCKTKPDKPKIKP